MTRPKPNAKPHDPAVCIRDTTQFKRWTVRLVCPICGRETNQNRNFISGRQIVCDGVKFIKQDQRGSLC